MRVDLTKLDAIVLSHWHRDRTYSARSPRPDIDREADSGGILKALSLRSTHSPRPLPPLTLDLHPTRPIRRGIAPPPKYIPSVQLPVDPTFSEHISAAGEGDCGLHRAAFAAATEVCFATALHRSGTEGEAEGGSGGRLCTCRCGDEGGRRRRGGGGRGGGRDRSENSGLIQIEDQRRGRRRI